MDSTFTVNEDAYTGVVTTATGARNGVMTIEGAATTFTNFMSQVYSDLTVEKEWDDQNNKDGIRPASISVIVYNQYETIGSYTLSEENGWTVTLTELPRYTGYGEILNYTVQEVNVPEGYTVRYAADGMTISVINMHRKYDGYLNINDYDVPLAAGLNMHEGDCFD